MKNFINTSMFLFLTVSLVNAQETIVPLEDMPTTDVYSGKYYFKDVNNKLNRFIGTWTYESPNETLIITFYKVERDEAGGDASDILNSNFIYTRNGVTVFDTFQLTNEDDIFIFGSYFDTPDKLMLYYSEPNSDSNWVAQLFIEIVEGGNIGDPIRLNWNVQTRTYKRVNGQRIYPFEIPSNLILEKQY